MKLLFDQNISHRLVKRIADVYPKSNQVQTLGLENVTDLEIWEYAKKAAYTIVTFDTDFYDYSVIKGTPPKIIWIRTGNLTIDNLEILLRRMRNQIELFTEDNLYKELSCLEIIDSDLD